MQSAIDFGKSFLTQYFNKRDPEASKAFLADDVIWITPNDIRHLKTPKSIRDFLAASIREDTNAYNVDIASIKSAPVLETTSIVVYDINLIPKHKESAVNLRCTLAFHKQGVSFAIVYVGMSRKYLRTDTEQIRGFADALPGGIMTLTVKQNDIRLMYASAWFFQRLGYEEAVFYEEMEKNPFFMMSYVEQKRMVTLVEEMAALKKPKPLAMQVNVLKKESRTKIPCHMSIAAAYKDGTQTVLYLIFDEISDVLAEFRRQQKKEKAKEKERAAEAEKEQTLKTAADSTGKDDLSQSSDNAGGRVLSGEADHEREPAVKDSDIETLRRDYEKQLAAVQIAANVRVEESVKLAKDEADAAERLIKAKMEQAIREKNAAVEAAKKQISEQFASAWKEAKEKNSRAKAELQGELEKAQRTAGDVSTENQSLKEQLEKLENERQTSEKQYQDRILKLEWQVKHTEEDAARQIADFEKKTTAEKEEAIRAQMAEKEQTVAGIRAEMEQIKEDTDAEKSKMADTIARQEEDLKRQEQSLKQKDIERQVLYKEKDKSIRRMGSLLRGQMQSVRSIAGAAEDITDADRLKAEMTRIEEIAKEMPKLAEDLTAISTMDPGRRKPKQSAFTIQSCLDLVRRIIWPECRAKGLIFSIGVSSDMPDAVTGNKPGLELAFLSILENAVQNTANGGRITVSARSDPAVRGSAYYHFVIADTGQGIPEDRLPVLFDNPESELSIARNAISSMGGAIQVRSKVGEGTTFEITVSLKLQE